MNEADKEFYKKIAEKDPRYVGYIILNLIGCDFCEIVGIGCCEDRTTCTQHIDDFLRTY